MQEEQRYCTECRAEIPRGTNSCPACGVFAGDMFDGRMPGRTRKPVSGTLLLILLIGIAGAAAAWYLMERDRRQKALPRLDTVPTRVVRQRPGGTRRATGAKVNEAEAIRALRSHFADAAQPMPGECLVVSSQGPAGSSYKLIAIDRCKGTRLGQYVVSGRGVVQKR